MKSLLLKIIIVILAVNYSVIAQGIDIEKGSFQFPRKMDRKEFRQEFSIILAKLPEEQIEATSSWIYAPLFTYEAEFGLPKGFLLEAAASSNIITYYFRGGAGWRYSVNKFAFGVNLDLAYWFGRLKHFGFDSAVNAWDVYPGFSVGYVAKNYTISLTLETNYILSIKQKADDIVTESYTTIFDGGTVGVFIEQPVWKDNFMTLGVKMNFSKIYWPAWAVFPSWDRFFFIPEVFVGFVL